MMSKFVHCTTMWKIEPTTKSGFLPPKHKSTKFH